MSPSWLILYESWQLSSFPLEELIGHLGEIGSMAPIIETEGKTFFSRSFWSSKLDQLVIISPQNVLCRRRMGSTYAKTTAGGLENLSEYPKSDHSNSETLMLSLELHRDRSNRLHQPTWCLWHWLVRDRKLAKSSLTLLKAIGGISDSCLRYHLGVPSG